jgi:hypothetical protein
VQAIYINQIQLGLAFQCTHVQVSRGSLPGWEWGHSGDAYACSWLNSDWLVSLRASQVGKSACCCCQVGMHGLMLARDAVHAQVRRPKHGVLAVLWPSHVCHNSSRPMSAVGDDACHCCQCCRCCGCLPQRILPEQELLEDPKHYQVGSL